RIDSDGRTDVSVGLIGESIRARTGNLAAVGGVEIAPPPPDRARRLLAAANRHPLAAEVLEVMSTAKSDRHYRVYEIIRADLTFNGIWQRLGGSRAQQELERYTNAISAPRHQRTREPLAGRMSDAEVREYS